jgi:hypothetical protein
MGEIVLKTNVPKKLIVFNNHEETFGKFPP